MREGEGTEERRREKRWRSRGGVERGGKRREEKGRKRWGGKETGQRRKEERRGIKRRRKTGEDAPLLASHIGRQKKKKRKVLPGRRTMQDKA